MPENSYFSQLNRIAEALENLGGRRSKTSARSRTRSKGRSSTSRRTTA